MIKGDVLADLPSPQSSSIGPGNSGASTDPAWRPLSFGRGDLPCGETPTSSWTLHALPAGALTTRATRPLAPGYSASSSAKSPRRSLEAATDSFSCRPASHDPPFHTCRGPPACHCRGRSIDAFPRLSVRSTSSGFWAPTRLTALHVVTDHDPAGGPSGDQPRNTVMAPALAFAATGRARPR